MQIYLIESEDYWYVGSTSVGIQKRFRQHQNGYGDAHLLYDAMQSSSGTFTISLLEEVLDRVEGERRWYDWYRANDSRRTLNGRRPCSWDGGWKGKRHSMATRSKMSDSARGHTVADASRQKISEASKGNKKWVGKTHTEASKRKISQSKKGKPIGPFTQEHKDRISAGLRGHVVSADTRAKISASMRARRAK